jgi:tRNA acetyltransferase TAN1
MNTEGQKTKRKQKYRADGTKIPKYQNLVSGPGIWVSCVKGRERQAAQELIDALEPIVDELWPIVASSSVDREAAADPVREESEEEDEDDIEKQMKKELKSIKRARKTSKRLASVPVNTMCLAFLCIQAPVDPVALVKAYLERVEKTGVSITRPGR